jgi:site-specific DNA-methyltransferase (adenine-specific)
MIDLIKGDCLEVMKGIPNGSIDAIITDPPYGTTACKWDSVIDFELMWEQLNRIIKPNGAIVLFGSEPFSSALRMSNIKNYKYDWIWEKNRGSNFATVKYQPFKEHEIISVFNKHSYYPIKEERKGSGKSRSKRNFGERSRSDEVYGINLIQKEKKLENLRYPGSIQKFNIPSNNQFKKKRSHPTQKPVDLMEYLIKTYTNENETVLDFTMGSGSTGVAAKNLNRNFIGIEMDDKYFEVAQQRIKENEFKLF